MVKKMLIDATHAEETRVVVVDGNKVEEFDFETVNKRQLAGNIYLAKVTRVEPSLQAAFVDYGGNRHGFLAFAEIHPDYYQIPVADRKALLEEERAFNRAEDDEDNRSRRRPRPAPRAEAVKSDDAVTSGEVSAMDVVDLGEETGADALFDIPRPTTDGDEGEKPYRAMDHASETDDEIESIAEEDVAEEIRAPRKPRARRYKIQEVVKVRQIMLVQVVKEERGNKGAALTTYLSLAGRYCVLMPNTARGGGISRKITQAADRKKLKEIASEIEVPEGAGLIIRTAGAKRTKAEIRRDYEYLMRLWEQVRELTLKSIAPAPIYEEGNLIKRSIRDLYNREIEEVLVEGEAGYRTAKDFMRMIMPSHAKQVQRYDENMPLFARYQVESYLGGMFNPVVQLKSGGYIVIGITEALVAIDVNSGRSTREGSIEDTALKTNLEAAEEVARQLRLRDLAGLIVIDFIDMEERKNNAAVEKRLKDKLKTDRARIQVGRISGFGLMEMSRQRLRPGMLESTTQPCAHCHGTGLIRSDDSLALQVLRQLEEEGTRKRSKEVLLRAPVAVVNFLMNQKREHIALIEARYGMAVRIEADPHLVSPDYVIEKFKTAIRVVPEAQLSVISGDASMMGAAVDEDEDEDFVEEEIEEAAEEAEVTEATEEAAPAAAPGDGNGTKKKRRRRRRRRGGPNGTAESGAAEASDDEDGDDDDAGDDAAVDTVEVVAVEAVAVEVVELAVVAEAPPVDAAVIEAAVEPLAEAAPPAEAPAAEAEPPKKRTRARTRKVAAEAPAETTAVAEPAPAEAAPKPKKPRSRAKPKAAPEAVTDTPVAETPAAEVAVPETSPDVVTEAAPVAAAEPAPAPEAAPADLAVAEATEAEPAAEKPRRKGWWSVAR
jgi:ribonuclease E